MKDDKCINLITVHSRHPVSAGDSGRSLPDICSADPTDNICELVGMRLVRVMYARNLPKGCGK